MDLVWLSSIGYHGHIKYLKKCGNLGKYNNLESVYVEKFIHTSPRGGFTMNKKKKSLMWLLAMIVLICLAGCSKKSPVMTNGEKEIEKDNANEDQEKIIPTQTPTLEPTATPTLESTPTITPSPTDWYDAMLDTSVVSTGNNERLKKVIEKARNGEDVYLAAIGGSITEGAGATSYTEGYAYQFFQQFKELYGVDGGDNIHEVT